MLALRAFARHSQFATVDSFLHSCDPFNHLPGCIPSHQLTWVQNVSRGAELAFKLTPELAGTVYYSPRQGGHAVPVIMILHGNHHSTCVTNQIVPFQGGSIHLNNDAGVLYTLTGSCDPEQVTLASDFIHHNSTQESTKSDLVYALSMAVQYAHTLRCQRGGPILPTTPLHSHKGYAYIARTLAAHNFIVISISANRAISSNGWCNVNCDRDDPHGYLAWARLGLAHLEILSLHSRGLGKWFPSTMPRLNLSAVGLFGHSRGGLAARIIYDVLSSHESSNAGRQSAPCTHTRLCRPIRLVAPVPAVRIEAILEVAPTDTEVQGVRTPTDVNWGVMIPECDGDVSTQEGRCPFDRLAMEMERRSSNRHIIFAAYVPGADHNVFNSQWHLSDAQICFDQPYIFSRLSGWDNLTRFGAGELARHFLVNHALAFYETVMISHAHNEQLLRSQNALDAPIEYLPISDKLHSLHIGVVVEKASYSRSEQPLVALDPTAAVRRSPKQSNCYDRTRIIRWNTCLNGRKGSGERVVHSCQEPLGRLACAPGYGLQWDRCHPKSLFGSTDIKYNHVYNTHNNRSGVSLYSNPKHIDIRPYSHLTFSIGRDFSELNAPTFTTDVEVSLVTHLGRSRGVRLSRYLHRGALHDPSGVLLTQSAKGVKDLLFVTQPRTRLHISHFPALQTVTIPIGDLTKSTQAIGMVLTLDRFQASGALLMSSAMLVNLSGLRKSSNALPSLMTIRVRSSMDTLWLITMMVSAFTAKGTACAHRHLIG
jgi:hypothetical protein